MAAIIAYYRVSTKRQGDSGLGLEGQKAAVEAHAKQTGAVILATYREVESGRKNDRPELARALAHAKRSQAVLVVAKMDRLARNAAFLLNLRDSGVDFAACDNPTASRLTVGILAVVAEDEAERISARTKAALTAYKVRGGLLGGQLEQCRNLTQTAREKGARAAGKAVHANAMASYSDILPMMKEWRAQGDTLAVVAKKLHDAGHTPRNSDKWTAGKVHSVLARCV